VIVFGTVLLPGTGAALAIFRPSGVSFPTLLASMVAFGYALTAIVAAILMLLGYLTKPAVVVTLIVVTAVLWIIGLRRNSPAAWAKWTAAEWRQSPWDLAAGFLAAVLVVVSLRHMTALLNFGFANPWRYWADGQEVAASHGLPAASLQWGISTVPTVSKVTFNAADAAFSLLVKHSLPAIGALMFLGLIGVLLAAWAFAWELGLQHTAPLLVLFAGAGSGFLSHGLVFDSGRLFGAESFSRMIGFTAVAVAIRLLRADRAPAGLLVIAGAALGIACTVHLIPASLASMFFGCYALFSALLKRSWGGILRTGVIVLTALVLIFLVGFWARGRLGFQAASGRGFHQVRHYDPTFFLATGRLKQAQRLLPAQRKIRYGGWYALPSRIYRGFIGGSLSVASPSPYLFLPVLFLLVAVLLARFAPERLRAISLAAWLSWMIILVIALVFSRIYSTYVPAEFPERRLFHAAALPLVLVGLVMLEWILYLLLRNAPVVLGAVTLVLVIGASFLVLPGNAPSPDRFKKAGDALAAMRWIASNTPCDARIMASNRTGGVFQVLTGRTAITEGMAPYLRPELLTRALRVLIGGRDFFKAPTKHEAFLTKEGVDYVMVGTPFILDRSPLLFPNVNDIGLGKSSFLQLVHLGREFIIYKVIGKGAGPHLPDGTDFAGYRCASHIVAGV
jgi:hypothetical protein